MHGGLGRTLTMQMQSVQTPRKQTETACCQQHVLAKLGTSCRHSITHARAAAQQIRKQDALAHRVRFRQALAAMCRLPVSVSKHSSSWLNHIHIITAPASLCLAHPTLLSCYSWVCCTPCRSRSWPPLSCPATCHLHTQSAAVAAVPAV
jgi:hypothetical protein